MKNRYFLITAFIMLIGILTMLIQSGSIFNSQQTSYTSIGFHPDILNRNSSAAEPEVFIQDLPVNIPVFMEAKQAPEGSNSFGVDSTFDIMSIPDPQLRALLSGNMNPNQKEEAENQESNFTKPEPVSQPISLYTGEERTFGYLPQKPTHNPADEFFYLEVKQPLTSQTEIYLEYDLYGVEDNTQVSRSINDQPVFGGYVVKQHNGWSKQSELLNPDLLKQGINTIRFSIDEDAKYSYTIKNLKLHIAEKETSDNKPTKAIVVKGKKNNEIQLSDGELNETENDRRLIVNQPTTAYYYRRFGFVQGFVTGQDYDKAQIRIGNQKVRTYKGEFESMISRNSQGQEAETDETVLPSHAPWNTTIEAVFPDGEILSVDATFEKPAQWDHLSGFDANIHFTEEEITQNENFELALGTAVLQGIAGSLQENATLSITALRAIDLPKLNPGMVNVTADYDGYRFLPHGSNFDKPLNITIGYDSAKLPKGHYPQEIRTYYYDENRSHWVALPRDSVNKGDYLVCSRTTHFTDMINAIVKAPEMPETQEYTPTSLKELQAADPSSGIQMLQPPTANSQGTASLSYPINVPAGRQGIQPNLAVSYSSEAANGLLGMGWDMQIPAITVDTKWGVPRYSTTHETETYLYNGEELLPSPRLSGFDSTRYPSGKQFHPRVEGGFEKIERKGGTSPTSFFWIVTDKQGTKYYYGTYTGSACDTSVVLKDKAGNIAHWPLCKVIDIHGNYMKYCYRVRIQDYRGINLGQQLWLESIEYTGYDGPNSSEGAYKVVFGSEADMTPEQMLGIGCTSSGGRAGISPIGSGVQKITFMDSLIKSSATPANPEAEAEEAAKGGHCNVMLRKTDRNRKVLDNVEFDLSNGLYLTTDNIGNTPYFPVHEGDCFDIYEKYAPRCCALLDHSIQVCILDNCKIDVHPFYPVHQEIINGELVHVITIINECDCIDYNYNTPTVIQKVDQNGRVLEGVVFKLEDGTELITNSEGVTFPFDIVPGGSMRIDEVHSLDCCEPLPYPIHIQNHGNGHLDVEHGFSAHQGMVNGMFANIITISNKCDCPPDVYSCQTILRKVDQEGRTIQGVDFLLDNGRMLTTDNTGSTQSFNIREGEHITIHELQTLDCCYPEHLPIEIYGHGDCYIEVHPEVEKPYQEWQNGVLVNVILIKNHCDCPEDDTRLNRCQTILRKVDQYGNILEGVAFQIENGGQLRTNAEGNTSPFSMRNGEHITIHEVATLNNCTPLNLPIEIKKHNDCDIEVPGFEVHEEWINGMRVNVIYIQNNCYYPPTNPCKLRIKKVGENNRALQGGVFRPSTGGTMTSDTRGYTSSIGLQQGTVITITETQAPSGYQPYNQTIRIEVLENCAVRVTPSTVSCQKTTIDGEECWLLTIPNTPIPTISDPCKLRIKKVDKNGNPLQGAVFQTAGGLVCTTGVNGYTSDIPLEPGNTIELVESKAPEGYKRSTRITRIEVLENCNIKITPEMEYEMIQNGNNPYYVLTIVNEPASTTSTVVDSLQCTNCQYRIRKINGDKEGLSGAVFQIAGGGTLTTGADGYSQYMPFAGIVTLTETQAPAGYKVNSNPIKLRADENCLASISAYHIKATMDQDDDCHYTITVENDKVSYYYIHKIDKHTRRPIAQAGFGDGTNSSFTGENGNTRKYPLIPGQSFRIEEFHVPDYYDTKDQAFADVSVNANGTVQVNDSSQLVSFARDADGDWVFVFSNENLRPAGGTPTKIPIEVRCSNKENLCPCNQNYKPDLTVNARSGFRQSSKDKLTKIVVFYGGDCVRSYDFCYTMDYFGRAKLQAITQWSSLDTAGEKHMNYMEYYPGPEAGNEFSAPTLLTNREGYNAEFDKISGIPKKLNNKFNSTIFKPSVLGGSRTWSFGVNGGADIGLLPTFPLKTLSGGLYFSTGASYSKGRTTLMDINGDGLPDQVYSKGKVVYYRLQNANGDGFGSEMVLEGVENFLQDKSTNSSFGFQASAVAHGGYQKGWGSSETKVYFSDINGDGLPDLIHPNGVKYIGEHQNPPAYILDDCVPPIIEVDTVPLSVRCDTMPYIEPYMEATPIDAVQYDFVRVWVADLPNHNDLRYKIGGKIYFVDSAGNEVDINNFYGEEDSLVLSIQWHKYNGRKWIDTLLWIDTIGRHDMINMGSRGWNTAQASQTMSIAGTTANGLIAGDNQLSQSTITPNSMIDPGDVDTTKSYPRPSWPTITDDYVPKDGIGTTYLDNLQIKQGDTLYFRVHALRNGVNRVLVWDPTVQPNIVSLNTCEVENNETGRMFGGGNSAAESQLLQGEPNFYCPVNGKVNITYNYQNSEPLQDTVYYEIWHNNARINHFMILPGNSYAVNFDYENHYRRELSVRTGDSIRFNVLCGSNVNHTKAQWNPKVTYNIAFSTYEDVTDTVINRAKGDTLEYEIAPHYQYYHKILHLDYNNCVYNWPVYSNAFINSVKISKTTSPGPIPVRFTITQPGNRDQHLFAKTVLLGTGQGTQQINVNTYALSSLQTDKPFYVSCFVPGEWAQYITGNNCYIRINETDYKCVVYTQEESNPLWGGMYGRWGQFQYMSDDLILLDKNKIFMSSAYRLGLSRDDLDFYVDTVTIVQDMTEFETEMKNGYDKTYINNFKGKLSALPMNNQIELINGTGIREHRGYYPNSFINKSYVYIGGLPLFDNVEDPDEPDCDGKQYVVSGNSRSGGSSGGNNGSRSGNSNSGSYANTIIKGYSKFSTSTTDSYSLGVSIPGLGIGTSKTETYTRQLSDMMDLNGDGFPDIIRNGKVQYSKPVAGKWESERPVFGEGYHHSSTSLNITKSFTADPQGAIREAKNSGKGRTALTKTKKGTGYTPSVSASAATSSTYVIDITNFTLIDVNGDGLPDRVYHMGDNVALNIGYGFEPREYWNLHGTVGSSISNAASGTFNAGISKSLGSHSISLGMSSSVSSSQHKELFVDMNGDGIADRIVFAAKDEIHIMFNAGLGEANSRFWVIKFTAIDDDKSPDFCQTSVTNSVSGTVCITLGFPIGFWAKVGASAGADAAFSITCENLSFMDMDGDGFADIVFLPKPEENSDQIYVMYNQLGKTGLLKKVINPMGGTYETDYALTDASVMHSRRQVLSEVKIKSNHQNDPGDVMLTAYTYESGYYDRIEREFYGFAKVTEKQLDARNANDTLRKIAKYYHNATPYNKGLNLGEILMDGAGNKFILTRNKWRMRNPDNNMNLFTPAKGRAYPALDSTVMCYYEGQDDAPIRKVQTFKYDTFGRITYQTDWSKDMPLVAVTINYTHSQPTNYNISIPKEVIVHPPGNTNNFHRKRTTGINTATGQLTAIYDYYTINCASCTLKTAMTYNQYGNCTKIQYPNHSVTVGYESTLNTYPESVTNDFNETSYNLEYDFRFGIPEITQDIHGNEMHYTLDEWGRIATIQSPKERDSGQDYTIKYEYFGKYCPYNPRLCEPFRTKTSHFDVQHPSNDIETYTFSDGLGRIVQTKVDASINGNEQMIVSGKIIYDALGRAQQTYLPSVCSSGDFTFSQQYNHPAATCTYDVLDRPRIQIAHDGTAVEYRYAFENDQQRGYILFQTKVIDQNGYTSTSLSNVNQQQYEVQPAGHESVWFEYNPVGDLLQVRGVDFERSYQYDKLGRRTDYWEDNLYEHYSYDGENMTEKYMEWDNPHLGGYSATLSYVYKHTHYTTTRLEEIVQSRTDVGYNSYIRYHYDIGSKPVRIDDESGMQVFEYGNMGEVTKQARIFTPPGMQPFALETQFEYDSWGRTLNMTYPDGEIVNYGYDHGGQLITVQGDKNGQLYNYLENIGYNEFGAKTEQTYGNHMITQWQYNPYNQRLEYQQIHNNNSGENYLYTEYSYDNIGNITDMYNEHTQGNWMYTNHHFDYDAANQLINATEHYNYMYTLQVEYDNYGKMRDYILYTQDPLTGVNQAKVSNYHYGTQSNAFAAEYSDEYVYNNGTQYHTGVDYSYGINGSLRSRHIHDDGTGHGQDRTEYYLFDAYGNMNAYSDNMEKYAYYSYDDAGQRTYKMVFNNATAGVNTQYYPILEPENITFYPNGFINVNQYGEYTKHYYAETQRIASKIGTGSVLSENLCANLDSRYNVEPHIFDEKRDQTWDKAQQDLTYVVFPEAWVDIHLEINPICDLQAGGDENALFFYHGNHLSSTQMITDIQGDVVEQVFYAPFGEIVHEYNSYDWQSGVVPDYKFNGKELDPETGMYYYEARYYNPRMSVFTARDPLFEKFSWMSPYAYCNNNPVNLIDPTGLTAENPDEWDYDKETNTLTWVSKKGENTTQHVNVKGTDKSGSVDMQTEDFIAQAESYGIPVEAPADLITTSLNETTSAQAPTTSTANTVPITISVVLGEVLTGTAATIAKAIPILLGGGILFGGDTRPGQRDEMAQHGTNNHRLGGQELERLQAKEKAGNLTSQEKLKLKAHEKATNQRHSRQSKDKK